MDKERLKEKLFNYSNAVNIDGLVNENLRQNIEREGIEIYRRT